jgi:hypothetical protein
MASMQEFLGQIIMDPPPGVPEKRYRILAKQRRREWRERDLAIKQRMWNVTHCWHTFRPAELAAEMELICNLILDQELLVNEGISTHRLAMHPPRRSVTIDLTMSGLPSIALPPILHDLAKGGWPSHEGEH